MQYKRSDRVAALIKEEVSQIILRDLHDPDLGFITITKARLSNDLKHAKIFYSVLGDEEKKEKSAAALERSLKAIRSEVGHRIKLRAVPTLQFFFDDSIEYADRINQLLNQLNKE
jgi:ribosome-binding factor A